MNVKRQSNENEKNNKRVADEAKPVVESVDFSEAIRPFYESMKCIGEIVSESMPEITTYMGIKKNKYFTCVIYKPLILSDIIV